MKLIIIYKNKHIYRFNKVNSYHIFNKDKTIVIELCNGDVRIQSLDKVLYINSFLHI